MSFKKMTTTIPQREKIMIDEGMEQLLLYLNKDERLSATVIEFPIKMTTYGWQIASVRRECIDVESHEITDAMTEDIILEKLEVNGQIVYAGYGPATKTLVIGKPEQVIKPAPRMDRDPADNEFFPGVKG